MKVLILLLILGWSGHATTWTVKASGGTGTTLQGVFDNSSVLPGDVIEIDYNLTLTENVVLKGKSNIWIRSSRWRELLTPGWRVLPGLVSLMPTIVPSDNSRASLQVGYTGGHTDLNGVDTTADTIRWTFISDAQSRFANNMGVYCSFTNGGSLPAPLNTYTKYYLKNYSTGTLTGQMSLTPDGTAINLTTTGSAGMSFYSRPICTPADGQPDNIRLQGLNFFDGDTVMFQVGSNSLPATSFGPKNLEVISCNFTGDPTRFDRPKQGISIVEGEGHEFRDSLAVHIIGTTGAEAHAVQMANVGSVKLINNKLAGTGINIITGGGDAPIQTTQKDLTVAHNYIVKPGYFHWNTGHGPPAYSPCLYVDGTGAYYLDADPSPNTCANSACYVCQSNGTWAIDTLAP